MVNITVRRGAGDKTGNPIIEPLLTTEAAAVARGRAELDRRGQPKTIVTLTAPIDAAIRCGQIIEAHEGGRSWKGKVVHVTFRASGPADQIMELEVERYEPTP